MNVRRFLTAAAALLPGRLAVAALRLLGHNVAWTTRIGWSIVLVDRLIMASNTRIGHGNVLMLRRIIVRERGCFGRGNIVVGPMSVSLAEDAAIGNGNKITRAPTPSVSVGPARLRLGRMTKLTASHRIDCTASIAIGDHSILAGAGTQMWTHGYQHAAKGPGRWRIDGAIHVGDNVYIGSACIVTAGVRIGDAAIVGAGATVARSLEPGGFYVPSVLRQLPHPPEPPARRDLRPVEQGGLTEKVFVKRAGPAQ